MAIQSFCSSGRNEFHEATTSWLTEIFIGKVRKLVLVKKKMRAIKKNIECYSIILNENVEFVII